MTIYIRADGSIDPPIAPIVSSDNITYTLIDDVVVDPSYGEHSPLIMIIEKTDMTLDGNGHALLNGAYYGYVDGGIYIHDVNNVTIKNLTMNEFPNFDVRLSNTSHFALLNSTFATGKHWGHIQLYNTSYSTIMGCEAIVSLFEESSGHSDLRMESSSYNTIRENEFGVYLKACSNNIISDNNVHSNDITLNGHCMNNTISGNQNIGTVDWITSSNNLFCNNTFVSGDITLDGLCMNNTISGNQNIRNVDCITSSNNLFCNNTFVSGTRRFYNSSDNIICQNEIDGQLIIETSAGNRFYDNNFSYTSSVFISGVSFSNTWDNGYPSGGNYWINYNGTDEYRGPFQNETGSDGIGDASRFVDANNVDHYPIWVESDKDGLPDGWEVNHNLNPFNASDAWADSDLDGLSNLDEYWHKTSLVNKDTDSDGLSDGLEVHVYATDPTNNDTDGDGTVDLLEAAGSGFNAGAVVLPGNWSEIDLLWSTYTINILSNSSITGVHLDSVNRQLVINITGKETASGMFNMTAPKSMIISSSDIKLLLDNQPITISLQADATNYYISATYSHSTYLLIVSFKPSEQIVDYVPYLVGGTLVALFCILIIAVLRKKR
jgi:parallel beta-helix repeat protein